MTPPSITLRKLGAVQFVLSALSAADLRDLGARLVALADAPGERPEGVAIGSKASGVLLTFVRIPGPSCARERSVDDAIAVIDGWSPDHACAGCGHRRGDHARTLPAPCAHGKGPMPHGLADMVRWVAQGCQCNGFVPADAEATRG